MAEDKTNTIGYSRELRNKFRRFPSGRVEQTESLFCRKNPTLKKEQLPNSVDKLKLKKGKLESTEIKSVHTVKPSPFQKSIGIRVKAFSIDPSRRPEELVPYTGNRGGVGCQNTITGKIQYGDPTQCGQPNKKKKDEPEPKPQQGEVLKPKEHKAVSGVEEMINLMRQGKAIGRGLYVKGGKYKTITEYVLGMGRQFNGSHLIGALIRMNTTNCFVNATRLVLSNPDWQYVEGYVKVPNQDPVLHAWAISMDGKVVDNSLEYPERNFYVGIVYPRLEYLRYIKDHGYYGVLGGGERDAKNVIMNGGIHNETIK